MDEMSFSCQVWDLRFWIYCNLVTGLRSELLIDHGSWGKLSARRSLRRFTELNMSDFALLTPWKFEVCFIHAQRMVTKLEMSFGCVYS
jgi:hypothetical protein